MPRKKISEFRAKTILSDVLGLQYSGHTLDTEADWKAPLKKLKPGKYVVKVDQGVKGRFKKGLVILNQSNEDLPKAVEQLQKKGYRYMLVEPQKTHSDESEQYLAMERTRDGISVSYSKLGGIHVESKADAIKHDILTDMTAKEVDRALGMPEGSTAKLGAAFDDNFFSFLEINPLVIEKGVPQLLDSAIEVDDQAAPFVAERWTVHDIREFGKKTPEEETVDELASTSQASFSLKVLNPNGAVFLLLSGGGASVTLADEVHNQGFGRELANYGEYSGNPSEDETYIYTRAVLSLMLKSQAPKKVLIIGGGVANFTDVRKTFKGVIHALDDDKEKMRRQHIKVFVRRGGPYEAEGLAQMEAFLLREDLHGLVTGPEKTLSSVVLPATATIKGGK